MVRSRARSLAVLFAVSQSVVLGGCYTQQPVRSTELPTGMTIVVSITDAGRSALAERMGQDITSVQGRLIQKDSAGYTLAVQEVVSQRGGTQVWSGERVQIRNEYVNQAKERRFSRSRTGLVVGAVIGAVAILASQGLIGDFTGDDSKPPPDSVAQIKIPLFHKR